MRMTKRNCVVFTLVSILNCFILLYLSGTNRLATNDEARAISAGIVHWYDGDFRLSNDFPPLSRMAAVLPLLPLNVTSETYRSPSDEMDDLATMRDRELFYAGRFARNNPEPFNLFLLARMTGFLWWLLGAWIIVRWSSRVHGAMAGYVALIFWSFVPIVLGYEQLATPELPTAVICAVATYAFRRYLAKPSWDNTLLAGFLFGIAQLIDFVAIILLIIWPMLALVQRLARVSVSLREIKSRTRILQTTLMLALTLVIINIGYGFVGSGYSLEHLDTSLSLLNREPRPGDQHPRSQVAGSRFSGTWIGQLIVPLPASYIQGFDRRLHKPQADLIQGDQEGWPVEVGGSFRSTIWRELPVGIWALSLGSLILTIFRAPIGNTWVEEFTLWIPLVIFLVITLHAIGFLSPAAGVLLASPFAIVIASRVGCLWQVKRWKFGWLAIAVFVCSAMDCCVNSYQRFVSPNRTARFRQDLVRQGRKLGLSVPEARKSASKSLSDRGLIYRRFVDAKGLERNYAIFVPYNYRADRCYPLLLFLHGWGDSGKTETDLKYTEVGLPFVLKYRPIEFLVLIPQGHTGTWESTGQDALSTIELLGTVQKEYRIDPKRISLTGLSSGGTGVWDLAANYPEQWAAIIPVAGDANVDFAPLIKHIPCWCFHNRFDGTISFERPRKMIEALKSLGANPKYTEYSDTNHNAGERAFILPELYDWISQQHLP